MDARGVLLPLLLLATVLVDLAALGPSRSGDDSAPTILTALAGSQLSLAACYLVFGRAYVLWRVVAVALVLGALTLAGGWAGLVAAPQALVIGTLYLCIVSGALGVVRLAGGRATGRRLQFSLDEVYTVATLVCVLLGAAVTFDWRLPGNLLLPTIAWSGVMAMLTAGSLGMLRKTPFAAPALALLIAIVACSVLIDHALLWTIGVASILATALLVASLMVIRIAGGFAR